MGSALNSFRYNQVINAMMLKRIVQNENNIIRLLGIVIFIALWVAIALTIMILK